MLGRQFAEKLAQVSGNATCFSPQIHNEIVVAIGNVILDKICSLVSKFSCFALMADETKDASKIDQISVIPRFVCLNGFFTAHQRKMVISA